MPRPMNRTPRGQKPQVEHPFALLARLMHYVFRDYKFHCIAVFLLIFAGVIANVQGNDVCKNLIDDYITPFLLSDNPNFAPLARPFPVSLFFMQSVSSLPMLTTVSWSQSHREPCTDTRNDSRHIWEKLPIVTLIHSRRYHVRVHERTSIPCAR